MAKRGKAKGPQDDGIVAEITSTPDMTDERTALNRQLDGYIDASATEQKDWTPFRDSAVRMLLDDQLAGVIIREGWGRVQLNKIYPAITQEQAIHVQRWQNSDIMAKPMGEGDPTAVKLVEGRLRYHYFKNIDIPGLMLKNIMEADVGGEFVNKPYWDGEAEWDDDKNEYRGRVKVDLLDIQQFVIDPECGSDLTKARYMGTHMRKELDWALDRWPDEHDRIILAATSEAEDEAKRGTPGMGTADYLSRVNPADDVTMDGPAQPGERGPRPIEKGPGEGALANMVLRGRLRRHPERAQEAQREGKPRFITILEIYFLDFEKDKSGKRLYPFGRMILRVGTGVNAIVLNDEAVKQPDDEEDEDGDPQRWWMPDWPFVIGILRSLPGDTWRGMDSVVMLRSIQEGINENFAHLDMGVRLFSDPLIMMERDALELSGNQTFKDKLKAVAGAIWELAPNAIRNQRIKREDPVPLSADLYRVLDILIQHLSDTSGVHEVTRGSQSKGKATATEILQLQTNSRLRVGSQSWYADRFVVALLTMVMRIEMEEMSENDEIEIIDEDGTERREKLTQLALELDYGIEIRVVTALPWDAERSRELAMQLLEVFGGSPALARVVLEEFKKVLPSLKVDDVVDMMEAAIRAQQEAEAAEATAKAGPGETPAEEPIDLENEAPDAPP